MTQSVNTTWTWIWYEAHLATMLHALLGCIKELVERIWREIQGFRHEGYKLITEVTDLSQIFGVHQPEPWEITLIRPLYSSVNSKPLYVYQRTRL